MHLIVGLGNPGASYAGHRHNVGAMAVDTIAKRHGFPAYKTKFKGLLADGNIDGKRTLLLKPQTFMNHSGECVQAAAKFYKLPAQEITVIYDELDLVPGKVRVKSGGGNGGHNGLRSIDAHIGTSYQRVRVGIGHPGHKELVSRHVLSNFHKVDFEWLDPLLEAIAENAQMLIDVSAANFMNKLALAVAKADEIVLAKEAESQKRSTTSSAHQNTKSSDEGPLAGMLKKLFQKDNE